MSSKWRKPNKRNNNNRHHHFNNKFRENRPKNQAKYRHQNQLLETEVGITEFLSKLDGFSGIIKARYSDFHVNEIDLNGAIAKLTDTSIPKDFGKDTVEEYKATPDSPLELIPQSTWEAINRLVESNGEVVEMDAVNFSKSDREKVHKCVKQAFKEKIVATTITKEDRKFMQFKKFESKDKATRRFCWPSDKGEYVHFLVYKQSLDTLEASLKIGDCLKMSPSNFSYAGVKDKRAKTTQWFCVRKVEPWKLIVKTKSLWNIKIGNITFKDTALKLGQLKGNRFRIALRNVSADDDLIKDSLDSLNNNGFINYYGLQRFGNDKEVPTFSIGIQLLLGNWKEACSIILKATKSDDPDLDINKAKKIFTETGDVKKALDQFDQNKNKCIEYKLLLGLSDNHSNDYVNALEKIPRNIRLLYLHSFQSLVWNYVTSKRISMYGLKPVEGDLVLIDELIEFDEEEDDEKTRQEVKVLTTENCGNYTIYDVVLPLPGYDIIYPVNMKEYYQEILENYGLTLEMTKQKVQTYSLSGNYRRILGKVQDLTWRSMHYNDPNYNLIQSDWEAIREFPVPQSIENGKYKALILEFSLNSSSYATMVLREILKTDTSSSAHAKLNNYHEDRKEEKETLEDFIEESSFLQNKKEYEAFKDSIFNTEEVKRKLDEDDGTIKNVKVLKTC